MITSLTKLTYEGGGGAGSATAMNKLDASQIYPREFRRGGIEKGGGDVTGNIFRTHSPQI
jgi:hypothetical protein